MSLSISVYREGRFSHFLKLKKAEKKVLSGRWGWKVQNESIEEIAHDFTPPIEIRCLVDGPFGVGNMVPFAKIPSKLRQPQKLHYAIPACGAHGRRLYVSDVNEIQVGFEMAGAL